MTPTSKSRKETCRICLGSCLGLSVAFQTHCCFARHVCSYLFGIRARLDRLALVNNAQTLPGEHACGNLYCFGVQLRYCTHQSSFHHSLNLPGISREWSIRPSIRSINAEQQWTLWYSIREKSEGSYTHLTHCEIHPVHDKTSNSVRAPLMRP